MLRFATIVALGLFSFSASIYAQGNALTLDGVNDYASRARRLVCITVSDSSLLLAKEKGQVRLKTNREA